MRTSERADPAKNALGMLDAERLPDDAPSRAALRAALDRFRIGGEDLHAAAEAEGVAAWQLLEEAQAMPNPAAAGLADNELPPFIRRR